MTASSLAADVADADWVITGEGQFDEQSLHSKVVGGVTALARKSGAKVAVLAGRVQLSKAEWRRAGVDLALAIAPAAMSTAGAMKQAKPLLSAARRAGRYLARSSVTGQRHSGEPCAPQLSEDCSAAQTPVNQGRAGVEDGADGRSRKGVLAS